MPIELLQIIPEPYLSHLKFFNDSFKSAGFQCYLVGGSVRDLVMGKIPHEYDFTTNATPEDVKKLFRHVIETGIKHGTVTVVKEKINYEITTYRIDKNYMDGRRPESVEFGTSLSEDLKRRDFTMNALALDISSGEMIDEHGGLVDIQNGTIRTIGNPIERFSEDGLRPIRALRFASVLGFTIETETKLAISKTKSITEKVSVERFHEEVLKAFRGNRPSVMILHLLEEDIFSLFLGETKFSETAVFVKLPILDEVSVTNIGLKLCLCFFLLSPNSLEKELELWLRKLKFSGQIIKDCLFFSLIQKLWNPDLNVSEGSDQISDYRYKKDFLAPFKKHFGDRTLPLLENELFWKDLSILLGRNTDELEKIWKENPPLLVGDLSISGNDLAQKFPELDKKKYGIVLNQLLDHVLRLPTTNEIHTLIQQSATIVRNL